LGPKPRGPVFAEIDVPFDQVSIDLSCKPVGGAAGLVMDGGAKIDAITFDAAMDLLHAELRPISTADLLSLLCQIQRMPSVTTDELEFDFPIATK
jgi:hypothetical protein